MNTQEMNQALAQLRRLQGVVDLAVRERRPERDGLRRRFDQLAAALAKAMHQEMDKEGYLLLEVPELGQIAFVRDEEVKPPKGYVPYTQQELTILGGHIPPFVHEVKKAGARVRSSETHL